MLLADRSGTAGGGRRGAAPDLMELLPQWLAMANAHGFAAPPQALPRAAGRGPGPDRSAARRTGVRGSARAVARPAQPGLAVRAALHAGRRRRALAGGRGPGPGAVAGRPVRGTGRPAHGDPRTGSGRRPRAAGGHLADGARRGPADVPGLAAHRAGTVRTTSPSWSRRSPTGAATSGRRRPSCCRRCRVRRWPGGWRSGRRPASPSTTPGTARDSSLKEAPHECDAGMERDGVIAKAPAGRGERSWWFGQLAEAAPLATWPARLGGRTPREILAPPVADDWRSESRGLVPGGGAAAGRGVGAGAARPAVVTGGGRAGGGVAGRAGQAAGHAGRRGTGRVGGRVHRGARTVGGIPTPQA
ncbi:hypothetical protein SGLAM104S_08386 [Streptomyces glaucescens]